LNQSECISPRNSRVQMILCAMLHSWDNSIPLFLHAAIYLEVSVFRWTSQNAFPRETAVYKWYCVQCCIAGITASHFFSMLPSTLKYLYSAEPVRMHFPAKQPCTNDTVCNAAMQHCTQYPGYPSGLEKTLCKWDIYVSLVTKGLNCWISNIIALPTKYCSSDAENL